MTYLSTTIEKDVCERLSIKRKVITDSVCPIPFFHTPLAAVYSQTLHTTWVAACREYVIENMPGSYCLDIP